MTERKLQLDGPGLFELGGAVLDPFFFVRSFSLYFYAVRGRGQDSFIVILFDPWGLGGADQGVWGSPLSGDGEKRDCCSCSLLLLRAEGVKFV